MTDLRQVVDPPEDFSRASSRAETTRSAGFTVRDGVAIVVAAAVASLHLRTSVIRGPGAGWGMLWLTFAGVGLSAAGPVLLVMRWYGRHPSGYPRLGDWLWAVLGLPWLIAAPLRPARLRNVAGEVSLYGTILTITVGVASLVVLVVMWRVWVLKPPGSREGDGAPVPWTEKLGMTLAVAWPLQTAFLLIVLDAETLPPGP